MQQLDRHTFFGGLNHDNTSVNYPTTDYKALINARIIGNTEYGAIEAFKQSKELPYTQPEGRNIFIGGVEDVDHSYAFIYNSNGLHHIIQIAQDDSIVVLYQNSFLNFNKDMWIQAAVFGDHLYFTDDVNEPKYINITSALNGEYSVDIEEIYLIHRAPLYRPAVGRVDLNTNETIKIANNAYQFAYRYKYKHGQVSVLSPWSDVITYTYPIDFGDNLDIDAIGINIPTNEDIPVFVESIEFLYKELDNPTWIVFETKDRAEAYDDVVYRGQIGLAVSDGDANRLYDTVPVKARALDGMKSRVFMGNIEMLSTDNKKPVSLNISATLSDVTTISNQTLGVYWVFSINRRSRFEFGNGIDTYETYYDKEVKISAVFLNGSYYLTQPNYGYANPNQYPANAILGSTTYTANDIFDLIRDELDDWHDQWVIDLNATAHSFVDTSVDSEQLQNVVIENIPQSVYASSSNYQLALAFYDKQGRIGKVITDDDWVHTTEQRTWGIQAQGTDNLTTEILASPYGNVESIPVWASHYNVLRTKNLTTKYQVHGWSMRSRYVEENLEDGSYNYVTDYDVSNVRYFALSVAWLNEQGRGISYQAGDVVRIRFKNQAENYAIYTKQLVATGVADGSYVFFEPYDFGDISNQSLFFVYERTYNNATDELFYEVADRKRIINAGRANRRYQTEAFRLRGDVYVLLLGGTKATRNTDLGTPVYSLLSSLNPNIQSYHDVTGRALSVIDSGEHKLNHTIVFSGQYFVNGELNRLNTFYAFDSSELDPDSGGIQSLQNTSKVEGLGNVLLAICRRKVFSIYIGEAQLNYSSNEAGLAITDNVIGSINDLSSGYGCDNRESVYNYDGKVAWVDTRHGVVVVYSRAGLNAISEQKMSNHFRELLNSLHGSDARIYMGYLPNTMELFLTLDYNKEFDESNLVLESEITEVGVIDRLSEAEVPDPIDVETGTGLVDDPMDDDLVINVEDILTDTTDNGLPNPNDDGGDDTIVINYEGVTPDPNDNPDTGDGGGQVGGGDNGGTTNWYDDYTWIVLASNYSVIPFIIDTNSQGDVWQYEYESGNIAYRLVPAPYMANMDCFFLNYDTGTQVLSTEIACKTDSVNTI